MPEDSSWIRKITWLLASQVFSIFGSALVQYAMFWDITLQTQSGTMMTLAAVFGFLPMFVLSPFSGVLADRFDR